MHKFTIECKGDKLRYQAIITVLSGFLHHRLVDQHPKTETISALFVNLKSVFTNGIISVSGSLKQAKGWTTQKGAPSIALESTKKRNRN
jgi:hypothetical protein